MHWSHIGHILWQIFYWPGGIIVGNLLANFIWEPSRAGVNKLQLRKQTRNLKGHTDEQTATLNATLDAHHERTKEVLNEHHEKITKVVNGVET